MDLQEQERLLWHGRLQMSVVMVTGKFRFSWEKGQTVSASGLENLNGSYAYSLTRWGTNLTERDCRLIRYIAFKLLLSWLVLLYLHLRPGFLVSPLLTSYSLLYICLSGLLDEAIYYFLWWDWWIGSSSLQQTGPDSQVRIYLWPTCTSNMAQTVFVV